MQIKRSQKNYSVQFRKEIQHAIRPQGLGVLYSNDRNRTLKGLSKRYEQLDRAVEFSAPDPKQIRTMELYQKFQSGEINMSEFTELIKPYYPMQYNDEITSDIIRLEYYDYISQFKTLSKKERDERGGILSTINSQIKRVERDKLTMAERKEIQSFKLSRMEGIRELNKMGYVVGEGGKISFKGNRPTQAYASLSQGLGEMRFVESNPQIFGSFPESFNRIVANRQEKTRAGQTKESLLATLRQGQFTESNPYWFSLPPQKRRFK